MSVTPEKLAYMRLYYLRNRKKLLALRAKRRQEPLARIAARLAARRWRQENPHLSSRAEYNARRAATTARWIDAMKRRRGCMDCGTRNGELHFDHRDSSTKRFVISHRLTAARATLLAEIKKCDVGCMSCHMQRHGRERRAA